MANRSFNRLQALEKEIKKLQIKINTDGSADVASVEGLGVTSVSHSANQYTITLDDKYNKLMHVSAIGGVAATFHVDSHDVTSAKTVVIESSAVQASTEIFVELSLKNTSVSR